MTLNNLNSVLARLIKQMLSSGLLIKIKKVCFLFPSVIDCVTGKRKQTPMLRRKFKLQGKKDKNFFTR